MNYKDKLIEFNSTDKYKREMEFARLLLSPDEGETVLDFGCGIGTFVDHLKHTTKAAILGHDTTEYHEITPLWFRKSVYFDIDKVSFIHSIAHIDNLEFVLEMLYNHLYKGGKVVVISPNPHWLEKKKNPEYVPDPTVINHYDCNELSILFGQAGFKIKQVGQFGAMVQGVNERIFLVAEK